MNNAIKLIIFATGLLFIWGSYNTRNHLAVEGRIALATAIGFDRLIFICIIFSALIIKYSDETYRL